jgi:dolichol-phosphate mannosyltransferase
MARPFTKVLDPMSGFLAFKRSTFAKAKDLNPVGYKIGLELIVKCGCTNVTEVPIHFSTRQLGKSKLTLGVQFEYLQHVIRLLRYTHPKFVSFFTFATVGLSGAFVYLLALQFITPLISSTWQGIAISVWIAMTWNFFWDRKYAFWYARSNIFAQYIGFIIVCSVGVAANFYITKTLAESNTITYSGLIGVVVGSAIGIIFNYFVSRLLVFRK